MNEFKRGKLKKRSRKFPVFLELIEQVLEERDVTLKS